MVPERYSFDPIFFYMIRTTLSKTSEVGFFLAIREQKAQKSANPPLLCTMPDYKLAV